ncbi:MAG: peptide deformylase [Clostridia bacterium]|nr:peptide deformylase [Clostridia bacterium]
MMVRDIVQIGNPILRKKCEKVTEFGKELSSLLDDMKETVIAYDGAGLAAPQIGVNLRVVVINVDEGYFELVNPVFVWQKGEQIGAEGCLSVRGKQGTVVRPSKVKILFQDRNGDKFSLVARDFLARAICHELDHLDGIIYTDKATNVRNSED